MDHLTLEWPNFMCVLKFLHPSMFIISMLICFHECIIEDGKGPKEFSMGRYLWQKMISHGQLGFVLHLEKQGRSMGIFKMLTYGQILCVKWANHDLEEEEVWKVFSKICNIFIWKLGKISQKGLEFKFIVIIYVMVKIKVSCVGQSISKAQNSINAFISQKEQCL